MPDSPRPEPLPSRQSEDRLAHALISRGLLTKEDYHSLKIGDGGETTPEAFLQRLVLAGLLTSGQARRAMRELPNLLTQQIPGYALLEKVGKGAMGVVFKARQLSMNRIVAIKVLHPKLAANTESLERLRRKAHTAAKLSHNNLIQAIDIGSAGPVHYFVMEFVEGKTIREELESGKVYTEKEGVEIVLQIAQALSHAGRRGLVHRDVKPANIVITKEGLAKLADLGLARAECDDALVKQERGLTIGTPWYIAPEQIEAREDIDARADLYSLGATLYHMVTGRAPFPSLDLDEVLRGHLHEELTPPDHINQNLSSGLGEVVECLMAKNRDKRYRNADDLIVDLEYLMNGASPKLARSRLEADTLKGLQEGETENEDDRRPKPAPLAWWLAGILGGLLGLSLLFNLFLLLRR